MEGCWWQPLSLSSLNQSLRGVVPMSKGHLALADSTPRATVLSLCLIDMTKALTAAAASLCRCQGHATQFRCRCLRPISQTLVLLFFPFLPIFSLFLLCCITAPFLCSVSYERPLFPTLSGFSYCSLHCFASPWPPLTVGYLQWHSLSMICCSSLNTIIELATCDSQTT